MPSAKNHCQFTSADGTTERACYFSRLCRIDLRGPAFVFFLASFVMHANTGITQPPITALTFTADSQQVIAGSQRGLMVTEWPKLDTKPFRPFGLENIHDIEFSPDGRHLLIAGGSPGAEGTVQRRSWPDLELVRTWREHSDVVYAVAWQADGQEWVSTSWDGFCRVCKTDATTSHVTMKSHSGPVFDATYLASGQIASAGADRTIVVWNAASGSPNKVLRQHTGSVHALAYQTVGEAKTAEPLLASASEDRTVRFWQPTIGRMVRFHRFASVPRSIAWTQNGRWLMVGCDDGTVLQLDPITLASDILSRQDDAVRNLVVAKNGNASFTNEKRMMKIEVPE